MSKEKKWRWLHILSAGKYEGLLEADTDTLDDALLDLGYSKEDFRRVEAYVMGIPGKFPITLIYKQQ